MGNFNNDERFTLGEIAKFKKFSIYVSMLGSPNKIHVHKLMPNCQKAMIPRKAFEEDQRLKPNLVAKIMPQTQEL